MTNGVVEKPRPAETIGKFHIEQLLMGSDSQKDYQKARIKIFNRDQNKFLESLGAVLPAEPQPKKKRHGRRAWKSRYTQ
jgi:hypothetical protein